MEKKDWPAQGQKEGFGIIGFLADMDTTGPVLSCMRCFQATPWFVLNLNERFSAEKSSVAVLVLRFKKAQVNPAG